MSELVTDMNARERKKFVEKLRQISKDAADCADHLEAERDSAAMVSGLTISLTWPQVSKELLEIFIEAKNMPSVPDRPSP